MRMRKNITKNLLYAIYNPKMTKASEIRTVFEQ